MLGYQRGVKGYRLWSMEPGNQKIAIHIKLVMWMHSFFAVNFEDEDMNHEGF